MAVRQAGREDREKIVEEFLENLASIAKVEAEGINVVFRSVCQSLRLNDA